jgi:prepilin-type N-terminal cleavage/methylation domain-containing protein
MERWRTLYHDGADLQGDAVRQRLLPRLFGEESGFTLVELLVTMMMMLTVMFALYSIFDMSLRVFSFGNDKTEATENARLGLERMEREIRAAYPQDKASDNITLFTTWTADQVTFGHDQDIPGDSGYRKIESDELISYRRDVSDPTTLVRENNATSQPVVEFVDGLTFEYLDRYGTTATSEPNIYVVRISLTTEVDRSLADPTTQTLSTDVALRNRTN